MRLRGFGDILGFQQSGLKDFKLADPIHHEDLFEMAEKNIKDIERDESNFIKYELLLKLFDKADIVNACTKIKDVQNRIKINRGEIFDSIKKGS